MCQIFAFLAAHQKQKMTLCDCARRSAGTGPPWKPGHLPLSPREGFISLPIYYHFKAFDEYSSEKFLQLTIVLLKYLITFIIIYLPHNTDPIKVFILLSPDMQHSLREIFLPDYHSSQTEHALKFRIQEDRHFVQLRSLDSMKRCTLILRLQCVNVGTNQIHKEQNISHAMPTDITLQEPASSNKNNSILYET